MKKIISLFTTAIMIFCLCSCGENKTNENIVGTYRNVSFFLDKTYHLNENSTYKKEPYEKGTYKKTKKGFSLLSGNDSSENIFVKKDDYYYRTNLICCFEKDEEYGLKPTFDENGYSSQSFTANYETLNSESMLVKTAGLILNNDGTYKFNDMQIYITKGNVVSKDTFEGTYKFENDILWLNYEGKDYPMLFVDDKLYFDIIEKTE